MAGPIRRIALLAAVALIAGLAVVGPSAGAGAAGFTADEALGTTDGNVDLAVAPNGAAIVAWSDSAAAVVRVSVRPPGGPWSAPQALPVSLTTVGSVGVAIASSGAAAVSWQESASPSTFHVAVSTRPAGGAFGAPELLRDGTQTLQPAIGIDRAGVVTLLYTPSPDTSVRDFAAGTLALAASPQVISPGCSAFFSRLAVAPSGDAVAGYRCSGAVFALRRAGRWAVSPKVPDNNPGGSCPSPTLYDPVSVAIDSAGDPVGLLQSDSQFRLDNGFSGCTTQSDTVDVSLVLPLAGLMTPVSGPPAVSGTSFFGFDFPIDGPTAAISPAGIVFAWGDGTDSLRGRAKVRFYATDGSGGSAPQTVGSTPSVGGVVPALGMAADGRALLAWTQVDRIGADPVLVAAERPPGGSFGEPAPVSGAGGLAFSRAVGMADAGDAAVAWLQGEGAPYAVHLRGHDVSAPSLSGVAIPPTATASAAVSFAALASDVWGPVTVRWDFGDGASATGAAPQHAYAAAGRFTVSVTATDAVGNGSEQTGVLQVAAAVAPGGPPPVLSSTSVRPATFRVARGATAVSAARGRARGRRRARARAPAGTIFRFTLDRAATVTIAFARQARGLRAGRGGRCVRPTRRLARARARRCTRLVAARALTRSARAGAGAVPFSGRVGRRALGPGRYRATLTARAGGRAGAPRTLRFRVVR